MTMQVLVSSINFANGLELAQDESYLIFCETGRATIHKYYLKGLWLVDMKKNAYFWLVDLLTADSWFVHLSNADLKMIHW